MVGFHRPVLRADGCSFDQGQKVPLHAFAADITAACIGAGTDLVDFIQEYDPVLLNRFYCIARHDLIIQQLVRFLANQHLIAVRHGQTLGRLAPAHGFAKKIAQVHHACAHARLAGDVHHGEGVGRIRDLKLDHRVIQHAIFQLLTEHLACAFARIGACNRVNDPLFCSFMCLGLHIFPHVFAGHRDGGIDQIADDLFHVASDIADFGEFGRFHLQERRAGQLGEAPGNLRLADARRADHQDILGCDFGAQGFIQLLASPAIAQRDGDRALGVALGDNVTVQLGYDFTRREGGGVICHVARCGGDGRPIKVDLRSSRTLNQDG